MLKILKHNELEHCFHWNSTPQRYPLKPGLRSNWESLAKQEQLEVGLVLFDTGIPEKFVVMLQKRNHDDHLVFGSPFCQISIVAISVDSQIWAFFV